MGYFNAEGPPVPIPNTVVKLCSADNTCLATGRKDRSWPTLAIPHRGMAFFFSSLFAPPLCALFTILLPLFCALCLWTKGDFLCYNVYAEGSLWDFSLGGVKKCLTETLDMYSCKRREALKTAPCDDSKTQDFITMERLS